MISLTTWLIIDAVLLVAFLISLAYDHFTQDLITLNKVEK